MTFPEIIPLCGTVSPKTTKFRKRRTIIKKIRFGKGVVMVTEEVIEADFLCIGGGIAGLMAAIRAAELGAGGHQVADPSARDGVLQVTRHSHERPAPNGLRRYRRA
jgi:hypothetical protein